MKITEQAPAERRFTLDVNAKELKLLAACVARIPGERLAPDFNLDDFKPIFHALQSHR